MNILLFDHPQTVTQGELSRDLLLLPYWRRAKARSYHSLIDQVLCTKAYLLLMKGLKEIYGIHRNPTFDYIGHQKPVLHEYPHIHFNLSHCRKGVLCVIADQPVGCDIEEIQQELDISLCHFCHNDSEVAHITASAEPCVEFTKLWTKFQNCL